MPVKTAADLKPADWKFYRPFQPTEENCSSTTAEVDAYSVAKDIAIKLIRHYGAKKIILFGSLARGDLHLGSDIDLAVWGIPASKFYRAVAFATGLSKTWKVDLVDGDDCSAEFSEIIQQEGVERLFEKIGEGAFCLCQVYSGSKVRLCSANKKRQFGSGNGELIEYGSWNAGCGKQKGKCGIERN